jgi:hypothetical protein
MPSVFKSVVCPNMSPWGAVQHRKEVAPGIWSVATASHGGIYLSDARMAKVPAHLQETHYSRGNWFEEDCDWAIVVVTFPEAFEDDVVAQARLVMESIDKRAA